MKKDKYYYKDGTTSEGAQDSDKVLHREDGPAIECASGDKFWCVNGKCHRMNGPAIEYADGSTEWYLNGKRVLYWSARRNQFELPHSDDAIDKEHAQLILASVGIADDLEGHSDGDK